METFPLEEYDKLIAEMRQDALPPDGAISKFKIAKDLGLDFSADRNRVQTIIDRMVKAGKLESVGRFYDTEMQHSVTFYKVCIK